MGAVKLENLPHYEYEDYAQWDGDWELIDGIAYSMSPSPVMEHQNISANISYELKNSLKNCNKCQSVLALDWVVSEDTVVCPDNMVVCNQDKKSQFITKTPEIIFEILSPSTMKKDRTTKYNLFQENGVKYYILVEPKIQNIELFILENGSYSKVKSSEIFTFNLTTCSFKLNFGNIFD
ncbi:MAG: Uma2 family endonuclease [Campylobacterota bacterium]|nr:Uma2 family endonuclease [Campylobacterota bacterium]